MSAEELGAWQSYVVLGRYWLCRRNTSKNGIRSLAHEMESARFSIVLMNVLCWLLSVVSVYGVQFEPPVPTWRKVGRNDAKDGSSGNQGFEARNGHGLCVFKDSLWVVAGRSEEYVTHNIIPSVQRSDVWKRCVPAS